MKSDSTKPIAALLRWILVTLALIRQCGAGPRRNTPPTHSWWTIITSTNFRKMAASDNEERLLRCLDKMQSQLSALETEGIKSDLQALRDEIKGVCEYSKRSRAFHTCTLPCALAYINTVFGSCLAGSMEPEFHVWVYFIHNVYTHIRINARHNSHSRIAGTISGLPEFWKNQTIIPALFVKSSKRD